jgi:hypothetical protein
VFKAGNASVRIMGVSVSRASLTCNRVYVLTSDKRLNVLEVRKASIKTTDCGINYVV